MAIPNKPTLSLDTIETFCDRGMVLSLCGLIFVLSASIAILDSFAGLTVFFYFLKKINRIVFEWPLKTPHLSFLGKIHFIWKGFAPVSNILNRPLQLLTLAVFISVLFSQYPALSLLAFLGKFLKVIILYFSFIEVFKNEKRIQIFLGFFLAAAFLTALNGVVQHYTGDDFLKGRHILGGRVSSFFFGANGFGAYLLPVIGLASQLLYSAIVRNKSWIWGGVFFLLLVLLLACLCLTYSRSSWIGFLILLIVIVLLDRRKALFSGTLFLIFIFIFLPSLNNVRHLYLINDNSSGMEVKNESLLYSVKPDLRDAGSGRFKYWKKAISIIRQSPFFGTGPNTYIRIIKRDPNQKVWWYAHNCYLQMAAETGLVGLACFLWMLFVLLRYAIITCYQMKDSLTLTCLQGTLSGLCGFLVQSFFDNTFYTVQLGVLMWLTFGLTVALVRNSEGV